MYLVGPQSYEWNKGVTHDFRQEKRRKLLTVGDILDTSIS